ncbi:MAG: hypothetical protein ATN31_08860 [Candidatus Epulonipiscioides saccharophilum]|nr:MAG: hypothetical protein ATN31_08860 [Epulopiscium sp. AS2M-Bin001]
MNIHEFNLLGKSIVVTQTQHNYVEICKHFNSLAKKLTKTLNFQGGVKSIQRQTKRIINIALDDCIEFLIQKDVQDLSKETFVEDYFNPYYDWPECFEKIKVKYFVKNKSKKVDLHNNDVTNIIFYEVSQALCKNIQNLSQAVINVLAELKNVQFDTKIVEETKIVELLIEDLKCQPNNDVDIKNKIYTLFQLDPFNLELYNYIINNDIDKKGEIIDIANYYGVDITDSLEKKMETYLLKPINNMKQANEIKADIVGYMDRFKIKSSPSLYKIDALLKNMAKEQSSNIKVISDKTKNKQDQILNDDYIQQIKDKRQNHENKLRLEDKEIQKICESFSDVLEYENLRKTILALPFGSISIANGLKKLDKKLYMLEEERITPIVNTIRKFYNQNISSKLKKSILCIKDVNEQLEEIKKGFPNLNKERVIVYFNDSIWSNSENGFMLTNKNIYNKSSLAEEWSISLDNIESIKLDHKKILVNNKVLACSITSKNDLHKMIEFLNFMVNTLTDYELELEVNTIDPNNILEISSTNMAQLQSISETTQQLESLANLEKVVDTQSTEQLETLANLENSADNQPTEQLETLANLENTVDNQMTNQLETLANLEKIADNQPTEQLKTLANLKNSADTQTTEQPETLANLEKTAETKDTEKSENITFSLELIAQDMNTFNNKSYVHNPTITAEQISVLSKIAKRLKAAKENMELQNYRSKQNIILERNLQKINENNFNIQSKNTILNDEAFTNEMSNPILNDEAFTNERANPILNDEAFTNERANPILDEEALIDKMADPILNEEAFTNERANPILDEEALIDKMADPILNEEALINKRANPILNDEAFTNEIANPILNEEALIDEVANQVLTDEISNLDNKVKKTNPRPTKKSKKRGKKADKGRAKKTVLDIEKVDNLEQQARDILLASDPTTNNLEQQARDTLLTSEPTTSNLEQQARDTLLTSEPTTSNLEQQARDTLLANEATTSNLEQKVRDTLLASESTTNNLEQQARDTLLVSEPTTNNIGQQAKDNLLVSEKMDNIEQARDNLLLSEEAEKSLINDEQEINFENMEDTEEIAELPIVLEAMERFKQAELNMDNVIELKVRLSKSDIKRIQHCYNNMRCKSLKQRLYDITKLASYPKKLINAKNYYAKFEDDEEIILLYDDTIFGNAKSGFVITTKAIYTKVAFKLPTSIHLIHVSSIRKDQGVILINDVPLPTSFIEAEDLGVLLDFLNFINSCLGDKAGIKISEA